MYDSTDNLRQMMNAHHERICKLEDQKYDLELFVKRKDFEVQNNYLRFSLTAALTCKQNISRELFSILKYPSESISTESSWNK